MNVVAVALNSWQAPFWDSFITHETWALARIGVIDWIMLIWWGYRCHVFSWWWQKEWRKFYFMHLKLLFLRAGNVLHQSFLPLVVAMLQRLDLKSILQLSITKLMLKPSSQMSEPDLRMSCKGWHTYIYTYIKTALSIPNLKNDEYDWT